MSSILIVISDAKSDEYGAIVAGGGQAGLPTGVRLPALSVSYSVIEKTPQVGDTWRNRYDSQRSHTPKISGVLFLE